MLYTWSIHCTNQPKYIFLLFSHTSSIDKSPSLRHCAEPGRGGYSLHISSPSAHSSCIIDSSAASRSGLAVDSLFNDSSIQHIIDKYTRELNISLSAAGRTTGNTMRFKASVTLILSMTDISMLVLAALPSEYLNECFILLRLLVVGFETFGNDNAQASQHLHVCTELWSTST